MKDFDHKSFLKSILKEKVEESDQAFLPPSLGGPKLSNLKAQRPRTQKGSLEHVIHSAGPHPPPDLANTNMRSCSAE